MSISDNSLNIVIRSHASFNNTPHRRDWSYGIVQLENDKFTFVDVNGNTLVNLSAYEIKKIVTQNIGFTTSLGVVTASLDNKPQIFNFALYRVDGEEVKHDTQKPKAWRDAFSKVGVKNDNRKLLLIFTLLVILLLIFFIISNWNSNAQFYLR